MGHLHRVDGPPRFALKAATAIGLSLLFVLVYSGTNWFTSLRTDVGTWRYDWECLDSLPALDGAPLYVDRFVLRRGAVPDARASRSGRLRAVA